jgi:hypothetical protein
MAGDVLNLNPWKIDESGYPKAGSVREQLAFCVNYAVLAPSIHNTQPWLFHLLDGSIEVCLDRSRMLPATDPDAREMTISCGAALTNLLVAIRHFGNEASVQYMPETGNPDLVARVRMGRARSPDHQDESLFRSIRRRRSVRRPFQSRPVPRELQRRLIWLASEYGCWLYFAEFGLDRDQIADLVEQAHQRQLNDPAYLAERASRIAAGELPGVGGLPVVSSNGNSVSALGNGITPAFALAAGQRWRERDRELVKSSPVLFMLGTSGDTPLEWLRAGEALQQILLLAESVNVSASFLNQPCQVPDLREQLRLITGRSGPPHVLLRMGYGTGAEPTSRRPVQDVIIPPVST